MILVRPEDALHKAQLIRLITSLVDHHMLSHALYFKGGTCASMMGILDRFSVDLDFDLQRGADEKVVRKAFREVFDTLGLRLTYENTHVLEFMVKYPSPRGARNTLKVNALNLFIKANKYTPIYLPEIDRTVWCQTKETLFANKLVAPIDRYEKYRSLAGRDIYDIHHFFAQGLSYERKVIEERMGVSAAHYLERLQDFIEQKITDTVIHEDLNTLLPKEIFQRIRKTLKTETLMFLRQELARLL